MGKALEKAKKKFWYDHDYDKGANHWNTSILLNEFEDGWRAALEWAKGRIDYANAGNDMIDWIFEEELNAKT
jgi:hypothetical protein